ncbi:hypothetical protein NBT05_12405 [Aquimarina sp. ERC-38]|uniref:LPD1 domain-containing protein n=1 Tax=Aquimarina sp. ERC-38 TaxID=2949996 RepID=UPI0022460004|nr:LPD1 domain-containing protein [Aquimarina sp. ERC-38]UZO79750.1 hypothetical protein NBT05_12405 [Aquimarina sp. ERC-38]
MDNLLGKIEDAGTVVYGGGIDRYWTREGIDIDFKKMFNDTKDEPWMYDSNLALEHFQFKSIEFGNWMSQQDRANFLYASTLSLHHLALLLDIKDSEIGMKGKLSLALGARGKGKAAAHYERYGSVVINLTKTQGIGSLAHEYGHAVDNLLSVHTGQKKQSFVSGGRTTRKGYDPVIAKSDNYFEKQCEELFNVLFWDKTGEKTFFHRYLLGEVTGSGKEIPKDKRDEPNEYLNRRNEIFTRTFEVYVWHKLQEQGIKNTFLVKPSYNAKYYPSEKLMLQVAPFYERIFKRGFNLMKRNAPLAGVATVSGCDGLRKTLKDNASLDDTLTHMQRIARRDMLQVKSLAFSLQGGSIKQTSNNIWDYLRENTRYKLDQNGIEELRTPARSLHDGKLALSDPSYGIDCDDYTILISAILLNLGIRHEYRVTAYEEKGNFGHIYPVALDTDNTPYIIDVVPEIPHFNYEAKPIIDLKTIPMELHELSGVGTDPMQSAITSEEQQELLDELNEPFDLAGIDEEDDSDTEFEGAFLSGFGEVLDPDEAEIVLSGTSDVLNLIEQGIKTEIYKAEASLKKELRSPSIVSQTINVPRELALLSNVKRSFDNESTRITTLKQAIASGSSYANFYRAILATLGQMEGESLQGVANTPLDEPIYLARMDMKNSAFDDLLDESDPKLNGLGSLGRRRRRRGLFRKIWRGVKKVGRKVGKGIKKAVKAVVRFNPLTVVARAAIRTVLSLNMGKIASRLIYGYLTEAQANQKGLDLNEWRKLVRAKDKAEKFYTKIGGKADRFKRAIVRGRAAKKTGLRLGAAATATSTAAASPFLIFIKKILSTINPAKLFKKVATKVFNKRGSQRTPAVPFPTRRSPMSTPSFTPTTINRNTQNFIPTTMNPNPSLVPTQKPSFISRVKMIFNKHKKKIITFGAIGLIAIIGAVIWQKSKKKKKRSLAGIKAAKTRARNRRKALAGVPATRRLPARRTTTTRRLPAPKRTTPKRRATTVGRVKKKPSSHLAKMHAKAKQLQKKHPNTKYATLLKRASKQI